MILQPFRQSARPFTIASRKRTMCTLSIFDRHNHHTDRDGSGKIHLDVVITLLIIYAGGCVDVYADLNVTADSSPLALEKELEQLESIGVTFPNRQHVRIYATNTEKQIVTREQ